MFTFVKVYWSRFLLCKSVENLMNQKQLRNKRNFLFISHRLNFVLQSLPSCLPCASLCHSWSSYSMYSGDGHIINSLPGKSLFKVVNSWQPHSAPWLFSAFLTFGFFTVVLLSLNTFKCVFRRAFTSSRIKCICCLAIKSKFKWLQISNSYLQSWLFWCCDPCSLHICFAVVLPQSALWCKCFC